MNAEDPLWAGRLDLSRVGAFGFSIGGSTSAELCRTDPRIRAGAGMDGVFFLPQALENPLPKPFTLLRADTPEITMPDGRADDRLPVIEKMTRDGYYIQLAGTVHWSFADYPLLTTEDDFQKKVGTPRSPLLAPTRINQLSASFLVSFFRKYLLDQDDHRLDHPQSDIPEILNFVSSDALARRY
jgi:predicted dienelactone hydrolase